jgi:phosphate acyltransferase
MRIAVDVMGSDHGPEVVLEGVRMALRKVPSTTDLFLVGRQAEIEAVLTRKGLADPRVHVINATEVLTMKDKPLEGVRKKRDSSMVRAIEMIRLGKADALISPGNTGALVAGSMKLRRLEGVERPALAARMPSRHGDFVLVDAGANAVCEALQLAQFAVMGTVYASEILGLAKPRVGVLSNGAEETKGNSLTREAARLCSMLDLNFIGYVEGFDLFNDAVDVVVTDGFTGNIVVKTAESLSYTMTHLLKMELTKNPWRKCGALLSRGAFRNIKRRMDPEIYGGAMLLGMNGNVIKAHGSARPRAIMNAVRIACEAAHHHLNDKIEAAIAQAHTRLAASAASQPASALA